MNKDRFINRLKVLRSIDHCEVSSMTRARYQQFAASPYMFMMIADAEETDAIWQALLLREPK